MAMKQVIPISIVSQMEDIYDQINAFRANPIGYSRQRGLQLSCNGIMGLPLRVVPQLESETDWQATHLDCVPISHKTCPQYCHLFGGCSHIDRIKHFLPNSKNQNEVMVKGPKRPLKHLIQSPGHCRHLLDPDVNAMGGSIFNNTFFLALVWLL